MVLHLYYAVVYISQNISIVRSIYLHLINWNI
nr:MAG TPA: hypothetical protein [Caudoviricetes sp.]